MPDMLGPPPLGARPEGLLDILAIKSGGKFPQHLGPELQGTFDLAAWYLEQRSVYASNTFTFSTSAQGFTIGTVPANQQWLLRAASIRSTALVPATITRFGVSIEITDAAAVPLLPIWDESGVVGGDFIATGFILPTPIILAPGCAVKGVSNAYAGTGSPAVEGRIRYVPLPL